VWVKILSTIEPNAPTVLSEVKALSAELLQEIKTSIKEDGIIN
jgi:hypothetical protein